MGTRRLQAVLEFDVKGEGELKQFTGQLKDAGNAGTQAAPGLNKAASGTSLLSGAAAKLIAGGAILAAGQQLLQFGQASIMAASDVQEMQSKFDTVFKSLGGDVTAELEKFADAANRSVFDLQGFAATLQDTFVPLGFARDEAAQTSIEIVKLAEDLASFNNLDTGDVVRDLQSALVGNTETLRKYGVVASQAAIDQEALSLGLEFTKGSMDAQTKAAAILSLTMKGTTDAQGDAIRTADSYANVNKGLEAAVTDLKVAIGEGLLPVMTDLKSTSTETVTSLTGLINTKNLLYSAVQKNIITQQEFVELQIKAALSSETLEEVSQEVIQALEDEAKAAEAAAFRTEKQAIAMGLAAAAAEEARQEVIAYSAGLAESRGPSEEFADKLTQTSAALDGEALAVARARGELNLLTGTTSEANVEVSQLQSLLASLPSEKDIAVDLQVFGINTLERAQRLLNSLQGFQSGPGGSDPYGGLTPGESRPGTRGDVYAVTGEQVDQGINPVQQALNSSGFKQ